MENEDKARGSDSDNASPDISTTSTTPVVPKKKPGSKLGKKYSKMPLGHEKRWPKLVDLVDEGTSWISAYQETYPELTYDQCRSRLNELRYRNKKFTAFLDKRTNMFGDGGKMSKKEYMGHLMEIARFNISDLYRIDDEGDVRMKEGWLEMAKKHNILNKITVKRKIGIDPITKQETTTEIMDITPYSRLAALSKLGKVYGYESTSTKTSKTLMNQQNNTFLVGQIDGIRNAVKDGNIPGKAKEINKDFINKMLKAEIEMNGSEEVED